MKVTHTSTIESGRLAECFCEPEVYREQEPEADRSVEGMRRIMHWIYNADCRDTAGIAARMYAVAFVINPGLIQNKSMGQIERETDGRISKSWLSKLASQFREEFNL